MCVVEDWIVVILSCGGLWWWVVLWVEFVVVVGVGDVGSWVLVLSGMGGGGRGG